MHSIQISHRWKNPSYSPVRNHTKRKSYSYKTEGREFLIDFHGGPEAKYGSKKRASSLDDVMAKVVGI